FFRDPAAFDALGAMARSDLLANPARDELRLLSLPCSSGEEPLSMAIALLEAGLPANRFRVDGVDISARALARAARASYGSNSFRGDGLEFRERHFADAGSGKWQPAEGVRARVRYQQGNLFAPDFLPGRGIYDYVFCRNVLIYFDQEMQLRALQVLLRLLAPGGCLFVGPSETGLLPRERLVSAQLPMAFAFRLAAAAGGPPEAPRKRASPAASTMARRRSLGPPPGVAERRKPHSPATDLELASLAHAQQLADQGRLNEAYAAGERVLREQGPSADAYCLLGTIRGASDDALAADALYRKALYLEPAHRESLAHLALLLESRGRDAQAQVLRTRLRRVDDKAGS
ncbi:MAG: CheR family methyltransferase, partial [Arenimonas sp.]